MRPNLIWFVLIFVAAQVILENLFHFVPIENYVQLHTSITMGIVDNVLPAFVIFWLCYKYVKEPFLVLVSLVWLSIETADAVMRIAVHYFIYRPDISAFNLNKEYLDPLYFAYIALPALWLWAIRRNFLSRFSASYGPSRTYLFFRRPQSVQDILISLTGAPTSHMAVIHRGQHYFFKRDREGFQKEPFRKSLLKLGRLIEIEPPEDFGKKMDKRVGTKYHFIKTNCVTVLRGTGLGVKRYDILPSFMMMRYL